ncbi:hydrolase [Bowmanella dokdonensis]|uniref:Hydrolase n=1 Tax=Bowmanella dokdonensis TaxID=751969 RepID=A0A939IPK4_9ALTE|nr:hydrolase [Bowmanella dokdonensis]MBN7823637.1 hydrolase [Bowmanella dokdonensis]
MPSAEFGQIVESDFKPPWWARNPHIQTIWPRLLQRRRPVQLNWESLDLPDGDFVELAWTPRPSDEKGLVICFHGLEGSVKSHYANDMLAEFNQQGWQAVMMHFRGCGSRPNRTLRAYHSGDTGDALYLLETLDRRFTSLPKVAVGFSLGANMLLKLLGEQVNQRFIKAAVAISPPFRLLECANSIGKGFSRLYQRYLLNSMCQRLLHKMKHFDYSDLSLDEEKVRSFRSFLDFDQHITAPLHGFRDALDYYGKCSAATFLSHIQTPTLVLHAKDDPFMSPSVVPSSNELSAFVRLELSKQGGHVGFMQGTPWRPRIWTHQRIVNFVRPYLENGQGTFGVAE